MTSPIFEHNNNTGQYLTLESEQLEVWEVVDGTGVTLLLYELVRQ